jgi:hypothetical protein
VDYLRQVSEGWGWRQLFSFLTSSSVLAYFLFNLGKILFNGLCSGTSGYGVPPREALATFRGVTC